MKRHVIKIMILLIISFLFVSVETYADNKKEDKTFWQSVKDTIRAPFDELMDWTTSRSKSETVHRIPEEDVGYEEQVVKDQEEFPEIARKIAEEGVEHMSGPAGEVKEIIDFVRKLKKERGEKSPSSEMIEQTLKKYGYDIVSLNKKIDKFLDKISKTDRKRTRKKRGSLSGCLDNCCKKVKGRLMTPGQYKKWSSAMWKKRKSHSTTYWDPVVPASMGGSNNGCATHMSNSGNVYLPCTKACKDHYR